MAETATLSEKLFIIGTSHISKGDFDQACTTWKTLADFNSAHYWGVNNAAFFCQMVGRIEESAPYWAKRADFFPARPLDAARAAWHLAFRAKNWPAAEEYIHRAAQLFDE